MVIVVETAGNFNSIPQEYQNIAKNYLFNKEFNSLDEILYQQINDGPTLMDKGFYIAERKVKNLPETITEANIGLQWQSVRHMRDRIILKAKVKPEE